MGWQLLTTIQSNLNSYTDVSPPNLGQLLEYVVEAVPSTGCVSSRANHNTTRSNKTQPVGGPIGVQEQSQLVEMFVYPNPAKSLVTVTTNASGVVKLYSIAGVCVKTTQVLSGQQDIALDHLAPGTYILELQAEQGRAIQRLVVQ